MAGAWMQIDLDLPEKPEVMLLSVNTGLSIEAVVGRLVVFWRWVERNAVDGFIPHANAQVVASVLKSDAAFLETLEAVNWLKFTTCGAEIPGWEKRFSKSAKQRILDANRKNIGRASLKSPGENGQVSGKRPGSTGQNPDMMRTTAGPKEEEDKRKKKIQSTEGPPLPPKGECGQGDGEKTFARFWAATHHKTGKEASRRAYVRAVARLRMATDAPDDPHAFLLDRMTAFAASPNAKPPDRTPIHPATWLNQGRYLDDPATWQFVPRTKHNEAIPI